MWSGCLVLLWVELCCQLVVVQVEVYLYWDVCVGDWVFGDFGCVEQQQVVGVFVQLVVDLDDLVVIFGCVGVVWDEVGFLQVGDGIVLLVLFGVGLVVDYFQGIYYCVVCVFVFEFDWFGGIDYQQLVIVIGQVLKVVVDVRKFFGYVSQLFLVFECF